MFYFPAVLFCSEMPKQNGANVEHSISQPTQGSRASVLTLVKAYEKPVITIESPGAEGNKYGFEGGRAVKIGKTYHLITTEDSGDPRYVNTRLGYWTSQDRIHWKRVSPLYEPTVDQSGNDILPAVGRHSGNGFVLSLLSERYVVRVLWLVPL